MKTTAVGAPLRHPAFQRLWLGLSILYLGDQFTIIVLLWFVLQLTGSGPAVGLVIPLLRPPRRRHRGDPRASAGSPPAAAGDGLRQPRPSGTHRGDSHALRPAAAARPGRDTRPDLRRAAFAGGSGGAAGNRYLWPRLHPRRAGWPRLTVSASVATRKPLVFRQGMNSLRDLGDGWCQRGAVATSIWSASGLLRLNRRPHPLWFVPP